VVKNWGKIGKEVTGLPLKSNQQVMTHHYNIINYFLENMEKNHNSNIGTKTS